MPTRLWINPEKSTAHSKPEQSLLLYMPQYTMDVQVCVLRMILPCPLLEACTAGRQDELGPVLLGEQSLPGMLAFIC